MVYGLHQPFGRRLGESGAAHLETGRMGNLEISLRLRRENLEALQPFRSTFPLLPVLE